MPKLTLRRAGQIVNRLKRETTTAPGSDDDWSPRQRRRSGMTFETNLSMTIDTASPLRVLAAREELYEKLELRLELMAIETRLRSAVGIEQASCGVSSLVTERVMVVNKQAVFDALLTESDGEVFNQDQFVADLAGQKEWMRTASSSHERHVTTPVLTASNRKDIEVRRNAQRRRLLEIDDMLAGLNSVNTVEIDERDLKLLSEQGLA